MQPNCNPKLLKQKGLEERFMEGMMSHHNKEIYLVTLAMLNRSQLMLEKVIQEHQFKDQISFLCSKVQKAFEDEDEGALRLLSHQTIQLSEELLTHLPNSGSRLSGSLVKKTTLLKA